MELNDRGAPRVEDALGEDLTNRSRSMMRSMTCNMAIFNDISRNNRFDIVKKGEWPCAKMQEIVTDNAFCRGEQ